MEKWEIVLGKFLKKWRSKKEVIGAIVCGSYVTGNPSKHSDIDLHIILDSKTKWRERGNEIVDGILIEYFANPAKKHNEYFEEDYRGRKTTNAHMFSTGRILFDKTGELKKIVQRSRKFLNKKFVAQNKIQIEISKYSLWDMNDNLREVFDAEADEFSFVYHVNLKDLYESYSKFLQFTSIPVHKLRRFLTDERDKKKYRIANFPDQEFVKMYIKAIHLKDYEEMMKEYDKLSNYVLNKMGGFNIDGWKIKSPAK